MNLKPRCVDLAASCVPPAKPTDLQHFVLQQHEVSRGGYGFLTMLLRGVLTTSSCPLLPGEAKTEHAETTIVRYERRW